MKKEINEWQNLIVHSDLHSDLLFLAMTEAPRCQEDDHASPESPPPEASRQARDSCLRGSTINYNSLRSLSKYVNIIWNSKHNDKFNNKPILLERYFKDDKKDRTIIVITPLKNGLYKLNIHGKEGA
jgi:hypothetical protein